MSRVILLFIFFVINGFLTHGDSMDLPSPHRGEQELTYSVNLMWINRSLVPTQKYLFSDQTEEGFRKNCLNVIMEWVKKSDEQVIINFWYDSKYTPEEAVQNTKGAIQGEMENLREPHAKVEFHDIRNLELVQKNEEVFSDKMPVYFRADILRLIVGDALAQKKQTRYIVYSDLNIPPLSKGQLFDAQTLENLDNFGVVLARNENGDINGMSIYENAFYILDTHNENMVYATRFALIDMNIERAKYVLAHGYPGEGNNLPNMEDVFLNKNQFPQIIFATYPAVFSFYAFLEMRADIRHPLPEGKKKVYLITKRQCNRIIKNQYFIGGRSDWDIDLCGQIYGKDSPLDGAKYFEEIRYVAPPKNMDFPFLEEIQQSPTKPSIYDTPHVYDRFVQSSYIDRSEKRRNLFKSPTDLLNIKSRKWKYPIAYWVIENFTDRYNKYSAKVKVDEGNMIPSKNIPIKKVNKPPSSHYLK